MTRLERNRLKRQEKRRKYTLVFGLFICLSILVGGVIITNNVMVRMTSLPREKDLFYSGNIVREIGYYSGYILGLAGEASLWVKDKFIWLYELVVKWIHAHS